MTDKEMHRLSRAELLEMLIDQMKENEELRALLEEANKKLEERKIAVENSGSIAEAALKLGGVFEAAQKAVDLYLENVKSKTDAVPDGTEG